MPEYIIVCNVKVAECSGRDEYSPCITHKFLAPHIDYVIDWIIDNLNEFLGRNGYFWNQLIDNCLSETEKYNFNWIWRIWRARNSPEFNKIKAWCRQNKSEFQEIITTHIIQGYCDRSAPLDLLEVQEDQPMIKLLQSYGILLPRYGKVIKLGQPQVKSATKKK